MEIYPKLIKQIEDFIKINNREPLSTDFNKRNNLPSIRYIQRRFGSLKELRKSLNLTPPERGYLRSEAARELMANALRYEKELYEKIFEKYNDPDKRVTVLRQLPYQYSSDNQYLNEKLSDVAIVDKENGDIIFFDFFSPSTEGSFRSCIRVKRNKLRKNPAQTGEYSHKIYYVCVNDSFSQEKINSMNINSDGIDILSHNTFKQRFL